MSPYNVFGSGDSTDHDVMCVVDHLGSIQESKDLCAYLEAQISDQKKVNVNLCIINGGRISETFKGTADECNNAVFTTYELHEQEFPCLVNGLVRRDVLLKIDRSIRIILSFLSRTPYRAQVKAALKSDCRDLKIQTLRVICLDMLKDFGTKNGKKVDIVKNIAFQIGQTSSLIHGYEVYTKMGCAKLNTSLAPYLNRRPHSLENLEVEKQIYIDNITNWIEQNDQCQ